MFGKKHTEEAKKIMRVKRGTEKRYEATEIHRKITSYVHTNKKVSDETRLLLSKSKKGKKGKSYPHSPETKKKISEANKGKIITDETKKKLSEAGKGKIISIEARIKISLSKKGKKRKPFSDEWKMNLSNSKRGKTMSPEAKLKLIKTKTGMKYKERVCPHCNIKGGGGNMLRYHFDNCKQKKNKS